ncbi:MAG: hypothetical protein M1374_00845 [Firmicutes bacterium]|nr:hypothetical protein [Bacillota bacterium]
MVDLISSDRTRTSADSVGKVLDRTQTIDDVVENAGYLRHVTQIIDRDLGELHHQAIEAQINARGRSIAKASVSEMLERLSHKGFAWRDIASMLSVSVPALRRWRSGEAPTGENSLALARLLGLIDILEKDHLVADVAVWMEMHLVPEAPVRAIDLIKEGHLVDVIELAGEQVVPGEVLDRLSPDWKRRYKSTVEVFEADDGEFGFRLPGKGNT